MAPVTAEPEDQRAAPATARGRLRTSRTDREYVIGVLKAAFVQGLLTKDEFDARVGQTFASRTYAELATVPADIPAGLAVDRPPRGPARASAQPPRSKAANAHRCVVVAVAMLLAATLVPGSAALFLFAPLCLTALVVAGAQILTSRHEQNSRGRLPGLPAPRLGSRPCGPSR